MITTAPCSPLLLPSATNVLPSTANAANIQSPSKTALPSLCSSETASTIAQTILHSINPKPDTAPASPLFPATLNPIPATSVAAAVLLETTLPNPPTTNSSVNSSSSSTLCVSTTTNPPPPFEASTFSLPQLIRAAEPLPSISSPWYNSAKLDAIFNAHVSLFTSLRSSLLNLQAAACQMSPQHPLRETLQKIENALTIYGDNILSFPSLKEKLLAIESILSRVAPNETNNNILQQLKMLKKGIHLRIVITGDLASMILTFINLCQILYSD
jgi:hypothetical protein